MNNYTRSVPTDGCERQRRARTVVRRPCAGSNRLLGFFRALHFQGHPLFYHSLAYLADYFRVDERTIRRWRATLVERGLLRQISGRRHLGKFPVFELTTLGQTSCRPRTTTRSQRTGASALNQEGCPLEVSNRSPSGRVDAYAATPLGSSAASADQDALDSLKVDEVTKQTILRELAARAISAVAWLATFQHLLRKRSPRSLAAFAIHFARNPIVYEHCERPKAAGLYNQMYREFNREVD